MSEGAEEVARCRWCGGGEHRAEAPLMCPYVKALEFADTGGYIVTRVEFFSPVELFGPSQRVEAPTDDYPRKKSL